MTLDPLQERYLERFFPGLIVAVGNLGRGNFTPEPPRLTSAGHNGLRRVLLHLTYELDDGNSVQIKISSRLKTGLPPYIPTTNPVDLANWERFHYALHYGKRLDDCLFRFDLDDSSGHHVHMLPSPKEHVLSERVEPDVRNLDPLRFVQMVAAYREQGTYPVRKKS